MKFKYYNDEELEFFIDVIDNVLKDYQDKISSLEDLKDEFVSELKVRGESNG